MSYGDTYVRRVNATVDDEYQERIVHQAATVTWRYAYFSTVVAGAVLAWVLPGKLTLWSIIVLVPVGVAGVAGDQWMKRYSPRPRAVRLSGAETVCVAALILVWLAGIYHHISGGDGGTAWGGVVTGGITGGVVGYPAAVWWTRRNRTADEQRLNAELED
jgi:hypothetical protein